MSVRMLTRSMMMKTEEYPVIPESCTDSVPVKAMKTASSERSMRSASGPQLIQTAEKVPEVSKPIKQEKTKVTVKKITKTNAIKPNTKKTQLQPTKLAETVTKKVRRVNSKSNVNGVGKISTKGKSVKEKIEIIKEKQIRKQKIKEEVKPLLNIDKSKLLPTEELRGKLEKLLGENEDGLKYVTYDELRNNETVQEEILKHMRKSKKMMVITGAGISCNAGIPDFRSSDGLYNKEIGILKGKDMFDISIYRNYESILMFNRFMQDLYLQVKKSEATSTHEFIKQLSESNKLIKCYTQNIDGIERKIGLKTQFDCESWNDSKVIQLHGDLHELCCNLCYEKYEWERFYDEEGNKLPIDEDSNMIDCEMTKSEEGEGEESETEGYDSDLMMLSQGSSGSEFSEGSTFSKSRGIRDCSSDVEEMGSIENGAGIIECPKCVTKYYERVSLGKRSLESSIGIIRPNIVLYGEEHPYSDKFGLNISKDMNKKPNMLMIFGTSLRVTGVKKMVREMSKKVHENGGIVVLVNREAVSSSSWKSYIDYQIVSDCDAFCELMSSQVFASK